MTIARRGRDRIRKRIGLVALLGAVVAMGCAARVGISRGVELPKDSKAICEEHCRSIGLPLDSIVIVADNVGCVCREKADGDGAAATDAATSAAAGAIAQMIEDQRRRDAFLSASMTASVVSVHPW